MPQFDFYSFFIQLSWFFIFVVVFYLIYLKFFLKNISSVIKLREKILDLSAKLNKNIPTYLLRDFIKKFFK